MSTPEGALYYLIGASGCGKDSLIGYLRQHYGHCPGWCWAHRYITRPEHLGGESYLSLSQQEFDRRREAGMFALCWSSHGNCYGIGQEIDLWLQQGWKVLVNGSRRHLGPARQRYPQLRAVWVEVSGQTLEQRLRARGRENEQRIAARLERHRKLSLQPGLLQQEDLRLNNDGPLAEAGEQLARYLGLEAPVMVR